MVKMSESVKDIINSMVKSELNLLYDRHNTLYMVKMSETVKEIINSMVKSELNLLMGSLRSCFESIITHNG